MISPGISVFSCDCMPAFDMESLDMDWENDVSESAALTGGCGLGSNIRLS